MKAKLSTSPVPNKSRIILGILLTGVLSGGVISFLNSPVERARLVVKKSDIVSITLPPPPKFEPPPKVEPPPKPEMVEQEPVDKVETPEEAVSNDPAEDALGTNIAGNGPDMGLRAGAGSGARNRIGGRRAGKWDNFAVKVQNTIAETLRQNAGTRNASFSMKVLVWADANGRISRVMPVGSSGNPTVDQALKNQVFAGLQLPEPPPPDMPMPINMRISARRGSF